MNQRLKQTMILVLSIALLTSKASSTGVPQLIPYQGRLTDAADVPVTDGAHIVTFTIYTAATAGTNLWSSGFQTVITEDGLFDYSLGSNEALPDNLFTDTTRYLGVTIGVDPEISPRMRFETTPYSFRSAFADTASHAERSNLADMIPWAGIIGMPAGFSDGVDNTDADWSNLTNVPAGFADGVDNNSGGDITGVTAGSGLTGGGTNGTVTVSIATGGVTSAMIAENSITNLDLAPNSVNSSELAIGAVDGSKVWDNSLTGADIAPSSIGTSEVANNSLTATDLLNEPGIAFTLKTDDQTLATGTYQDILTVNITTPTPGYILVEANVYVFHRGTSLTCESHLQIDRTSGGSGNFSYSQRTGGDELMNTSNGWQFSETTLRRVYNLAAGTYTFRVEGVAFAQNNGSVKAMHGTTLSAIFYPTAYGTVTTAPPISPDSHDALGIESIPTDPKNPDIMPED